MELLIEITGALLSLLYLVLEVRQRRAMWVVGIISSAFYVYIFYTGKFYADMGVNLYYIVASIYGLLLWRTTTAAGDDRPAPPPVRRTTLRQAGLLGGTAAILFGLLSFVLVRFTDSPVPFGDALTTALSIVATYMLAHKLIEQWGVWFAVNTLSCVLYFWRGLYPTAVLYIIYAVVSVVGYFRWKREH